MLSGKLVSELPYNVNSRNFSNELNERDSTLVSKLPPRCKIAKRDNCLRATAAQQVQLSRKIKINKKIEHEIWKRANFVESEIDAHKLAQLGILLHLLWTRGQLQARNVQITCTALNASQELFFNAHALKRNGRHTLGGSVAKNFISFFFSLSETAFFACLFVCLLFLECLLVQFASCCFSVYWFEGVRRSAPT